MYPCFISNELITRWARAVRQHVGLPEHHFSLLRFCYTNNYMRYTEKDGKTFELPGGTKGIIFPSHPGGEQTIVRVEQHGVFPEKGYAINDRCTETIYMLEGTFTITINEVEHELNAGELIMILPGERHIIQGDGKSLDIITPSWDPSQNHHIVNGKDIKKH